MRPARSSNPSTRAPAAGTGGLRVLEMCRRSPDQRGRSLRASGSLHRRCTVRRRAAQPGQAARDPRQEAGAATATRSIFDERLRRWPGPGLNSEIELRRRHLYHGHYVGHSRLGETVSDLAQRVAAVAPDRGSSELVGLVRGRTSDRRRSSPTSYRPGSPRCASAARRAAVQRPTARRPGSSASWSSRPHLALCGPGRRRSGRAAARISGSLPASCWRPSGRDAARQRAHRPSSALIVSHGTGSPSSARAASAASARRRPRPPRTPPARRSTSASSRSRASLTDSSLTPTTECFRRPEPPRGLRPSLPTRPPWCAARAPL